MKFVVAMVLVLTFVSRADAGKPPVRSREECLALAQQRGFGSGKDDKGRGAFVRDCRSGKQN
jgi:hypothetical protein